MQMMQMHDKSDRVPLKSALALPCPSAIRYCRFFSSLHCCCRWTAPFFSRQGTQSFTTDIMDRTLGSAKKPCKNWKIITTILLRDLDSPSLSISIHYYRVVPKLYRLCSTKLYGQKYETNSSEHYEHCMQHSMPCSIYVHLAVLSFQLHSQSNINRASYTLADYIRHVAQLCATHHRTTFATRGTTLHHAYEHTVHHLQYHMQHLQPYDIQHITELYMALDAAFNANLSLQKIYVFINDITYIYIFTFICIYIYILYEHTYIYIFTYSIYNIYNYINIHYRSLILYRSSLYFKVPHDCHFTSTLTIPGKMQV